MYDIAMIEQDYHLKYCMKTKKGVMKNEESDNYKDYACLCGARCF